jgi:2-hydroxychromene-2-carboxylate isomerase
MKPKLEFFFFYGSIHTYLSVMRIEGLATAAGVELRWRPFNLREILIEQSNTSFAKNQVRLNYNWRDIERRSARLGVAFAGRPPYPVDPELLALRVGVVADAENWCPEYTKATFRAWFLDKRASGVPDHVEAILSALGKPAGDVIAQARAPVTDEQLKAVTEAARRLGIFGSPTFAVGQEIFWGDDRLEDAIGYAVSTASSSGTGRQGAAAME